MRTDERKAQIAEDLKIAGQPKTDHFCMQKCDECDRNTQIQMARNRILSLVR